MILYSIFFALGVWLLQQQAALPGLYWAGLLFILLAALNLPRPAMWQRIFRKLLLLLLAVCSGFFYAAWIAQQRLADELPAAWQGRDITLVGIVAEMPRQHERGLGFGFDVVVVLTKFRI